jgi:hypothetical protein
MAFQAFKDAEYQRIEAMFKGPNWGEAIGRLQRDGYLGFLNKENAKEFSQEDILDLIKYELSDIDKGSFRSTHGESAS